MRYTALWFATVLLAVTFAHTPVLAQTEGGSQYDYTQVYLVQDADRQFYEARVDFLDGKLKESADEIRKAVSYMKLEVDRTGGRKEADVDASLGDLEGLADRVENGQVSSEKELNTAFARAHAALAEHHYANAREAWKKRNAKDTGNALKAAAKHLKLSLLWAGYKGEEIVADALKETVVVADKLVTAGGWAEEEVDAIIHALGEAIKGYVKTTGPAKK